MAQSPFMLVRIKPSNKKEMHTSLGYTIRKSEGWCKIPTAVALELGKERMNELNPEASAPIFDVKDPAEARALVDAEQIQVEPAGTVDSPKEKIAADAPEEPKRRSRAQTSP